MSIVDYWNWEGCRKNETDYGNYQKKIDSLSWNQAPIPGELEDKGEKEYRNHQVYNRNNRPENLKLNRCRNGLKEIGA